MRGGFKNPFIGTFVHVCRIVHTFLGWVELYFDEHICGATRSGSDRLEVGEVASQLRLGTIHSATARCYLQTTIVIVGIFREGLALLFFAIAFCCRSSQAKMGS